MYMIDLSNFDVVAMMEDYNDPTRYIKDFQNRCQIPRDFRTMKQVMIHFAAMCDFMHTYHFTEFFWRVPEMELKTLDAIRAADLKGIVTHKAVSQMTLLSEAEAQIRNPKVTYSN